MSEQKDKIGGGGWDKVGDALSKASGTIGAGAKKAAEAAAVGSFSFNVSYCPMADIQDFQRQLHLLKDHLKNG